MISEANDGNKAWLDRPKLRPVEVIPIQTRDGEGIGLRDPSRISPQTLLFSRAAAAVLALFDGTNDLRDVQAAIQRGYGELVGIEVIEGLVRALDENHFLEGQTFDRFFERELAEFEAAPIRPAMLAGQAYAGQPEALAEELESYGRDREKGPLLDAPPRGLVAPHIDFQRGGPCYARAYECLDPESPPALVVILGTAHNPVRGPLVLCAKDFETPFGPARCESGLAAEMSARIGPDLTAEAFVHRGEHSVEFQAVWLKHRFPKDHGPLILPFLTASFFPLMAAGRSPMESPPFEGALAIIRALLQEWARANGPVMILASVDLSHVGPQFGDQFPVSAAVRDDVRSYDLQLLDQAARGDHEAFYQTVAGARDRTHVCGLASIYTMLRLIDEPAGRLLDYDQWIDPNGQGLVSFSSMVFP
ncbi:MAG: AmmeMemoRadiSam system protein B [Proteobacteria bacterium]|nr:AmmeMemoRadiSam system protein B [Pseudomonadota bacterium]